MRPTAPEKIETLSRYQVFVFGTNAAGFHGAGAAGVAFRGTAANTWRTDAAFLAAMRSPVGSPLRVGRWSVFGVARGPQTGREGRSYGIETVVRPGQRRSVPVAEIALQIRLLSEYARTNPDLEFLVTLIGCRYAGFSTGEIAELFQSEHQRSRLPDNLVLPREFEFRP